MRRILRSISHALAAASGRRPLPANDPHLRVSPSERQKFQSWGFYDEAYERHPRILISSGFGYGNVGDEAQLGACISRWKKIQPGAVVTLLSPNPAYTAALHGERVEWAPRVAWFRCNSGGPYFDDPRFPAFWKRLHIRLEVTARCMRGEIPFALCSPRECRVLQVIRDHDIIHISGGGFLTGKTRSRLWDNCLLMRMCQILEKPYFLTGHNIGVFQSKEDQKIAAMGLSKALYIGLRDKGISEAELAGIGIRGEQVVSSCDDALLCDRLTTNEVSALMAKNGIDPSKPWVTVNFHHWGQKEEQRGTVERRFAEICDQFVSAYGLQVVMVAMTPSDIDAETNILPKMRQPAVLLPYNSDYRVVRGVIADSALVFTMKHHPIVFAQGEGVPVVSVALDAYYLHKNKGALENTGDGMFAADSDMFFSDQMVALIGSALSRRATISQRMAAWTDSMRARQYEPYSLILGSLEKVRCLAD